MVLPQLVTCKILHSHERNCTAFYTSSERLLHTGGLYYRQFRDTQTRTREEQTMKVNHWSEILGNDVTAEEIVDSALEAGLTLDSYIAAMVKELADENPDAGWEYVTAKDCCDMADDMLVELAKASH